MAVQPYVRGPYGEIMSPEDVASLRQRSLRALQPDMSPVGHWTQGLARLVEALGGYRGMQRADRETAAGLKRADQFALDRLGADQTDADLVSMGRDPWVRQRYGGALDALIPDTIGARQLAPTQTPTPPTVAPDAVPPSAAAAALGAKDTFQPRQAGKAAKPGLPPADSSGMVADGFELYPAQTLDDAFGLWGWGANAINRASDAFGAGVPFPDVADARSQTDLLSNELSAIIADAFQRQPAMEIMRDIRSMLPTAGSAFAGPETARLQYQAVRDMLQGRLEDEIRLLDELGDDGTATSRNAARRNIAGYERVISRVDDMIGQFSGRQSRRASDLLSGAQGALDTVTGSGEGAGEGLDVVGEGTDVADDIEPPEVGEVIDGWRYMGGDPSSPDSWERVP